VGFDENKGIECIRLECASIAMGTACLPRAAAATTNELLIFIDDACTGVAAGIFHGNRQLQCANRALLQCGNRYSHW
jgi:hypothetical protein